MTGSPIPVDRNVDRKPPHSTSPSLATSELSAFDDDPIIAKLDRRHAVTKLVPTKTQMPNR